MYLQKKGVLPYENALVSKGKYNSRKALCQ